ncbi:adenine deaminase [Clostridium sp. Ade.TY]|uniref:adenine deaminase n=1 Tax=Clostridium sp. Ade.TY TaxID=1391647 RepID=UPI0004636F94|nr:adenine deaminase [Clostridium sp. Ade.TY]
MKKESLKNQIRSSTKKELSDLVIKNVNVIDVFQSDIFTCDVAIRDGYIIGLGEYSGKEEIDGTSKYIVPGLIDGHAHIESSLITPNEYYKEALKHGITSIVTDPHEIANVLGVEGIKVMMDLSFGLPLDFYFMISSCVPSTDFEDSGARIEAEDLKDLYQNKYVLGLAEVMNGPAVFNCDDKMLNKVLETKNRNLIIDGHCAGFNEEMINSYRVCNIKTDHECHTTKEVIDRLRRGMYVLMREGTVAKNLKELLASVNIYNTRRLCFCTDDKHIDDLIKNGSIDKSIKMAIDYGVKKETAIQMATLNTAECYGLNNKGAIAPGYVADFIILDNLESFLINSVYKNGKLVVKDNELIYKENKLKKTISIKNSINFKEITLDNLKIDLKNKQYINVIGLIKNRLESNHLKIKVEDLENKEEFISSTKDDLLKVAVIERHKGSGEVGLGIINGLKIKEGAIATSVAHDSHNIIVTGTNDNDMILAVNELKRIGGGIVVTKNNKVLNSVQLEFGGIITLRDTNYLLEDLDNIHKSVLEIAPEIDFNPFLTLSFLALPVIPELKITDRGLFDVNNFKFINASY